MAAARHLYRVAFVNQGKVYEVYCRKVGQGGLFGFVEIEDMVFGERTSVVVDPSEDKLRSEFEGVKRAFIPMHAVVRIDEVSREGHARISDYEGGGNVTPFPMYTPPGKK